VDAVRRCNSNNYCCVGNNGEMSASAQYRSRQRMTETGFGLTHSIHAGQTTASACAVKRRRFPVGARPTRRFAPAGSNRSSHGGNEMAEAFD